MNDKTFIMGVGARNGLGGLLFKKRSLHEFIFSDFYLNSVLEYSRNASQKGRISQSSVLYYSIKSELCKEV